MAKPRKRKDGRWVVDVELPKKPNGERNRKPIYGKTRQECLQNEYNFKQELEEQKILNSKDITIAQYMTKWLEINCAQLSPTTMRNYKLYVNIYIIPVIGYLKMREVMSMHIQELINDFTKTHRSKSAINLKGILNKAFNDAIENHIIKNNPCKSIKIRRSQDYEYYIYDEDEFNNLLNIVTGTDYEIPIILAALCGMRAGEIFGLVWENIDFDNKVINIKQTAVPVHGEIIIKTPKTYSSNRIIECPEYVIGILSKYKKRTGFVYSKSDGTPENSNNFNSRFQDLLKRENFPRTRFHDLRHFCASMMLKYNISDKEASELLGHSAINMTKKYQHIVKSTKRRVANMFDGIIKDGQNGGQTIK